jgi:proline iminopeptidase
MFVTVNDVRLHYEVEGTGPTLVMISLGGTPIYQRTFSPQLREHFQLVFLDLPGSGPSETGLIEGLTLETLLAAIDGVRQAVGADQIAVVGHSIHGLLAVAYAQHYPQHAWGAVVIGCPPAARPEYKAVATAYWETMASSERKALLAEREAALAQESLAALPPDQAFIRWYVSRGPALFADPTFDWAFFWEDCTFTMGVFERVSGVIFADYDPTPGFANLACPVFIALGVHDYPNPPTLWHPATDQLPNATYHAFEHSGHWPQYEEQALFDQKLIAWARGS